MAEYDPYTPVQIDPTGGAGAGGNEQGAIDAILGRKAPTLRNPITAGLSAGIDELQGSLGSGAQALGKLTGFSALEQYGKGVADRNQQEAQQNGRPDLDIMPWRPGGDLSKLPQFAAYQVAKQGAQFIPQLLGAAVAPEAAVPAWAARLGMAAPEAIGGGRALLAAGDAASALKAQKAGTELAARLMGATVAGYPQGVGQMYQQADERADAGHGETTWGDAAKAAVLGVPYAAMDALEPAFLGKIASKGAKGNMWQRIATAGGASALQEMPTEAMQTAMENSFRPDLTIQQKMDNVVDAALVGGLTGGLIGGATGAMRRMKHVDPNEILNNPDALKASTDLVAPRPPGNGFTMDTEGAPRQQPQLTNEPIDVPFREIGQALPAPAPQGQITGDEQPALPAPPPAPPSIAEKFAGVPDDQLTRIREKLETQIAGANIEPNSEMNLQLSLLRAEEQRRAEGREAQKPTQGGLFAEADYDQTKKPAAAPEPASTQTERDVAVKQMRDRAQELAGGKAQWINKLDVADEQELTAHVMERLENGASDQKTFNLAQKLGIVDAKGNVRDHGAEIVAAQKQLDDATRQAITNPAAAQQVSALQTKINTLQQTAKVLSDVQQRRAGGSVAEQQAQQAGPTVAAAPAPSIGLDLKPAPAQAIPSSGRETRDYLANIAGGKITNSLRHEDDIAGAVQKTADVASKGNMNQTYAKIAQHFGIQKDGVQGALDRLTTQRDALMQRINALTPAQAQQGSVLGQQASDLQHKIDVLQHTVETAKRRDFNLTQSATSQEIKAAETGAKMQKLRAISDDTSNPAAMRRDARRAMQEMNSPYDNATGHQKADAVISKHAEMEQDLNGGRSAQASANPNSTTQQAQSTTDTDTSVRDHADDHASDLAGKVIHRDGDTALILARSGYGQPVYVATKGSQRTRVDVDSYTGPLFNGREIQALRDAKAAHVASEKQAARAKPQGPFTGATTNVVSSESMDPRYASLLTNWMQNLGLGNLKVFLFHPEDAQQDHAKYGLHDTFFQATAAGINPQEDGRAGTFGPRNRHFYISLRPGMSEQLTIEALAHELGHIIKWSALQHASPEVKAAIQKDYAAWLERVKGMSPQEIVRALRNQAMGEKQAAEIGDRRIDMRYWANEDEYFADNVGKWLTGNKKPATTVQRFFATVGGMYKALIKMWQQGWRKPGDLKADAGIDAFMKSLGTGHPLEWNEAMNNTFAGSQIAQAGLGLWPHALNDQTVHLSEFANKLRTRGETLKNWSEKAFEKALGWMPALHIEAQYGKLLNGVSDWIKSNVVRQGLTTRWNQLWLHAFEKLDNAPEGVKGIISDLMKFSALDIDPRKSWDDHKHLHNEQNSQELAEHVARANKLWNDLGRLQSQHIYTELSAVNEALNLANQTAALYGMVNADPTYKAAVQPGVNPTDGFLDNPAIHESATATRDHYRAAYDALAKKIETYLDAQNAAAGKASDSDAEKIRGVTAALKGMLATTKQAQMKSAQSPYFHLGRSGEYMVAFDVRRLGGDPKADVDEASLEAIKRVMEAGKFDNFEMMMASKSSGVFLRVETASQAEAIRKALAPLIEQGHIIGGIEAGKRGTSESVLHKASPQFLTKYIEAIEQQFAAEKTGDAETDKANRIMRDKMVAVARESFFDMLPDTAMVKVMARRKSVKGYDKDMIRSFSFRTQVGINSLSNQAGYAAAHEAYKTMGAAISDAKTDMNLSVHDIVRKQQIMNELAMRDKTRQDNVGHDGYDTLRAFNHAYFLGGSVSYAAVNMTQPLTMLFPELGRKHGFVAAAKAMAHVTPIALKIAKAVATTNGLKNAAKGTITDAVLENAGLTAEQKAFVQALANSGKLEMGAAGRELGGVVENRANDRTAQALQWASTVGLYTETVSRLIAALSANELHSDPNSQAAVEYASKVVDESMFNYSNWNQPRQAGKGGFLGKATPLVMAFQTYNMNLIAKSVRELSTILPGSNATAQEKKEARRFIGAHFAAMTVVAGTMGLPAVNMMIRAAEVIGSAMSGDDDEPWDLKAGYRNFLSDMFGKDVGEVIAHGGFRAFGIEIANRAGEQDMIPFTKLLTDRRKFEDAAKDYAFKSMGSVVSMGYNIAIGSRDILKGDVISGMKNMLPVALKGPDAALDMALNGYHDKGDNALPLDPSGMDVLWQALGFTPGNKAEYQEAKMAQTVRKGELTRTASDLRKNLASAIEGGDHDAQRELMTQARSFDQQNPAYAVLPRMPGTLQQRAKARAMAQSQNVPMGTNLKDQGARSLTGFANY